MSSCPDDSQLHAFLNESLTGDQFALISVHVDECASCQKRLDRLMQAGDGAADRYKDLSTIVNNLGGNRASPKDGGTLINGAQSFPRARLLSLPSMPGFELIREIGRGAKGVVYQARHQRLNRLVALKMILAGSAADAIVLQRFLRESETLAHLRHPQIAQIFEVDIYRGTSGIPIPYLAMELLEGGSLRRAINSRTPPQLEPWHSAKLIEGIARALHCAHREGVIHGDLTAGNILFSAEEFELRTAPLPKLVDFGLGLFHPDSRKPGAVVPIQECQAIDAATDIRAIGQVLIECLTGHAYDEVSTPDSPPHVRDLGSGVPGDLVAIAFRCLTSDGTHRYVSALEVAEDLSRFLNKWPTVARPLSRWQRQWLWLKRNVLSHVARK